ncbi:MAG TPA: hypothetical protein EYP63_02170 [Desulfotomaculum sp.]|nr:hypothetical protein [Desulfotomaculum sp.]
MMLAKEQAYVHPLPRERRPVPKRRRRLVRAERAKISALVLLGFLLGLTVVLCQARMAYVGFCLQEFQKEMARVEAENQALEGAIQRLSSPDKVEALAVQKLGMVRPPAGQSIEVPVTVSQAPAGSVKPTPGAVRESDCRVEEGWLKTFLKMLSLGSNGSS